MNRRRSMITINGPDRKTTVDRYRRRRPEVSVCESQVFPRYRVTLNHTTGVSQETHTIAHHFIISTTIDSLLLVR